MLLKNVSFVFMTMIVTYQNGKGKCCFALLCIRRGGMVRWSGTVRIIGRRDLIRRYCYEL
jgi:hypothetical protein